MSIIIKSEYSLHDVGSKQDSEKDNHWLSRVWLMVRTEEEYSSDRLGHQNRGEAVDDAGSGLCSVGLVM